MKKSANVSILLIAFGFLALLPIAYAWGQGRDDRQIEERDEKPQGRAAVSVKVNQVRVDVSVQDKDGNLIQGFTREHFKVFEEGVQQELTYFEPIEAPMTAILVTEYSRVIPWEWLYEAWLASHVFVDQMRKEDWVAVVAYDLKPEILVDFTQNKMEIMNALRRLNFPAYRESNFYDTIWDVLDRTEEIDGKVALVVIASGLDTFSKKNLDETLKKVKQSNAVIYAVSLGGNFRARYDAYIPDMARMDLHQADAVLRSIAKYTGGEAFFPRFTQAFPDVFATISALMRHQYSLGYVSNNPKDKDYRKIKVEVTADVDGDGKPDKFKVRHREGYQVQAD